MQPFKFALIVSGILYTVLYDSKFFFIFLTIYGVIIAFNILYPAKYNNVRKRITIATWTEPSEGNIYGRYEVNTTALDKWSAEIKEKHGVKINTTHATIKACGEVLKNCPELNGKIVLGKYIPYTKINVSCLVDIDAKDLASVTVEDVDKMTLEDIAQYLNDRAKKIKASKGDEEHKKKTALAKILPAPLIELILEVTQILGVDLGLTIAPLGLKAHPFGGCMVTSVASLGIDKAIAPITPFTRVPFIATLGMTKKTPVVENDKIVIAPIAGVHITGDHRYIDGAKASSLEKYFKDIFDHPEKYSKLK